ncbi:MAG: hypothetical protein KAY37_04935 [Phycisphaerae bacterium]|nr:hypothetical protein [Phycisphaerae bacterium]
MTSNDAVAAMIDALEAVNVPYMLVGSYSCNAYGVARSTKDADFVVQLQPEAVHELCEQLGNQFRLDPQMSFETVTGTTRHIVHIKNSPFRIELFCVSDEPHDLERFARRRVVEVWGRKVYHPAAEDVVVTKLRWAKHGQRSKDTDDVRNVIAVQGDNLDWDYIHRWCDEHGTRELLDEIRRSIPKT